MMGAGHTLFSEQLFACRLNPPAYSVVRLDQFWLTTKSGHEIGELRGLLA